MPYCMQVQGVAKFVANRNLPPALKEDISRHLEGSQLIRNDQGEEDVFSRLSHTLQVVRPCNYHCSHPTLAFSSCDMLDSCRAATLLLQPVCRLLVLCCLHGHNLYVYARQQTPLEPHPCKGGSRNTTCCRPIVLLRYYIT